MSDKKLKGVIITNPEFLQNLGSVYLKEICSTHKTAEEVIEKLNAIADEHGFKRAEYYPPDKHLLNMESWV